MSENMVRTQVYLPRNIYDRLQRRAAEHELTLAVQIREALVDYLRHLATESEEHVMSPDDPLLALVGSIETGLADGSINHDQYIYVRDWGEPAPDKSKQAAPVAVKDKRAAYTPKRQTKRKSVK
ncbi:MAG TPA: hypothetical protein VFF59_09600 [Anaerolineae bacterium]|nr:hypothetical protein [Anaerolineae bacterium]